MRATDQLGCDPSCQPGPAWHAGHLQMRRDAKRRSNVLPAIVFTFYAGVATGWWLHGTTSRLARPSNDAPIATTGDAHPAAVDTPRLVPSPPIETPPSTQDR